MSNSDLVSLGWAPSSCTGEVVWSPFSSLTSEPARAAHRGAQSMNSQLFSAFTSKPCSFHSNRQSQSGTPLLSRARITAGSLSNQILMSYPKREIALTPALLQRKGSSPTNKQGGEFSAAELRHFSGYYYKITPLQSSSSYLWGTQLFLLCQIFLREAAPASRTTGKRISMIAVRGGAGEVFCSSGVMWENPSNTWQTP